MVTLTLDASLVAAQARELAHDSHSRSNLVSVLGNVLRFFAGPVNFICDIIDRLSTRIEGKAWAFKGITDSIEGGASLKTAEGGDASQSLIAELEKAQQALVELRETLQNLRAHMTPGKEPSRAAQSLRRLEASVCTAYDAIETTRWAIRERQADDDLAAGRVGPTFTNAADLIAHLNA